MFSSVGFTVGLTAVSPGAALLAMCINLKRRAAPHQRAEYVHLVRKEAPLARLAAIFLAVGASLLHLPDSLLVPRPTF